MRWGSLPRGWSKPALEKLLEPGETIAVVTGNGFDSFYVPLGSDLVPWQKHFVLAFYSQGAQAGRK